MIIWDLLDYYSTGTDPCQQQNQQNKPISFCSSEETGKTLPVQEQPEGTPRKHAKVSPGDTGSWESDLQTEESCL